MLRGLELLLLLFSDSVMSISCYCSPPGSSAHELLQARILEWVAILFSRGSNQGSNPRLLHFKGTLYWLGHWGSPGGGVKGVD